MKTVKHLDCTLRDGGYYNNWDFKDDLIKQYLQVLDSINVNNCEIGFRFYNNKGFKGSCAFSSEEFLCSLKIPKNIKISIMINANEIIENGELIIDRLQQLVPLKSKSITIGERGNAFQYCEVVYISYISFTSIDSLLYIKASPANQDDS